MNKELYPFFFKMQLIKHNLETQVCSSVGDSIKILLTCSMIAWQNKEWMPYEGYWKMFQIETFKVSSLNFFLFVNWMWIGNLHKYEKHSVWFDGKLISKQVLSNSSTIKNNKDRGSLKETVKIMVPWCNSSATSISGLRPSCSNS